MDQLRAATETYNITYGVVIQLGTNCSVTRDQYEAVLAEVLEAGPLVWPGCSPALAGVSSGEGRLRGRAVAPEQQVSSGPAPIRRAGEVRRAQR